MVPEDLLDMASALRVAVKLQSPLNLKDGFMRDILAWAAAKIALALEPPSSAGHAQLKQTGAQLAVRSTLWGGKMLIQLESRGLHIAAYR